jgi:predicted CxxxxCH...CXXCH cytochrome family protein
MARVKIRECWRCGGKAKVGKIFHQHLYVFCMNQKCHARGEAESTRDAAVAWWNTRYDEADEKMVGGND